MSIINDDNVLTTSATTEQIILDYRFEIADRLVNLIALVFQLLKCDYFMVMTNNVLTMM